MKKIAYSITQSKKKENFTQSGIGYMTDEDILIPQISKNGKPYIRVFEDCIKDCHPMIGKTDEYSGSYYEIKEIEEGIITATTKSRMMELEAAIAEINMKISAEENKMERTLKKSDVEKYIMDALELEAGMLIELLIEKIILYDDRVEIYYKTHNEAENPDEASEVSREFSLNGTEKITQRGFCATFRVSF